MSDSSMSVRFRDLFPKADPSRFSAEQRRRFEEAQRLRDNAYIRSTGDSVKIIGETNTNSLR